MRRVVIRDKSNATSSLLYFTSIVIQDVHQRDHGAYANTQPHLHSDDHIDAHTEILHSM